MHDALYANGGRFAPSDLAALARAVGLDVERFRAELIDGAHARARRARRRGARAAGITATPAFIVNGRPTPARSTPAHWSSATHVRFSEPDYPSPAYARVLALLVAALALFVAACGGGDGSDDAVAIPSRTSRTRTASARPSRRPRRRRGRFPPSKGKTLQELADQMAAGPSLALASSVFTTPGATGWRSA